MNNEVFKNPFLKQVESNSKIKYDMSQAWWQKASAIEDVSIALDCTEEHRKAFDDPAFTASWGRGSPRYSIFLNQVLESTLYQQ